MSASPRTCPQCRARLDSSLVPRNGEIRCPDCGARLAARKEADEALQTAPSPRRPAAAIDGNPRRPRAENADRPLRKKNGSSLTVPLLVGGAVGLFLLVAVCGGLSVGAFFFFFSPPSPPPVASVAVPPADAPPGPQPVPPPQPQQPPAMAPIQPLAPAGDAGGPKGALPLKELKAATVYIKASTAAVNGTGSGFVVQAQGNTVYVVTNHHVISPGEDREDGPQPPLLIPFPPGMGPRFPGMPIGPRIPGMPIGPRLPRGRMAQGFPPAGPSANLTAVFYSGTDKEQSLPAVVVGDDAPADLAILRVTGLQNAPRPIDCTRTPELVETMPVVAFGFPFGAKLDPKKRNPAVTVTKGVISSLRGDRGQLEEVQLDLDLNPGNSGGPVVDESGNLIGVAVAKVRNTRIGFGVPVPKLNRLLQGHIAPPTMLQSLTIQGRTQIRVFATASDPLGKLRSPTLLYGLANEVQMPRQGPQGWEQLAGAKRSEMTIQGITAAATLALAPPVNGQLKVLVQASYQTDAGQTIYGEPRTLSLGGANPQPPPSGDPKAPPVVKPPVVAARPTHPPRGEELTKLLADLKSPVETTRQRAASILQQMPPRQRREEVRRALQELLTSAEPATRAAGVRALAACDPKEAAPALVKLLADGAPVVRHEVMTALKNLKDPRAIDAVAARIPAEPLSAIEILKAFGPAAEKAVLPYLDEKYAGPTRFWVFNVLAEIGTAACLPGLEAVQGADRLHSTRTLQAVRDRLPLAKEDWPQALDDLKSTDTARRTKAARRIAATPPSDEHRADVVSRLEWLCNDQSGDVRIAAIKGLARWGGVKSIPILAKRLEGFDPGLHAAIIDVLVELKGDEAAAAIAKRLPDVHDRGKVVPVLKAMEPRVAEKAVLPLLANTDAFVRCETIKVLGEVGGRDSIAPLEKLAADNNVFYSGLAKEALAAIKDRLEDDEKK